MWHSVYTRRYRTLRLRAFRYFSPVKHIFAAHKIMMGLLPSRFSFFVFRFRMWRQSIGPSTVRTFFLFFRVKLQATHAYGLPTTTIENYFVITLALVIVVVKISRSNAGAWGIFTTPVTCRVKFSRRRLLQLADNIRAVHPFIIYVAPPRYY